MFSRFCKRVARRVVDLLRKAFSTARKAGRAFTERVSAAAHRHAGRMRSDRQYRQGVEKTLKWLGDLPGGIGSAARVAAQANAALVVMAR